jgi:cell shape-determining protein MreC
MQPAGPLTWLLHGTAHRARTMAENGAGPAPTREEFEQLRQEAQGLAQQVGHQQVLIAETEQLVADLSGLRNQLNDSRAKIIFASVVGGDTSSMRETLTISKGLRHGVRQGDWVAAGLPPDERDPEASGRDLLLRQWLIGRVSEAQPHLSRVQLTTDPHFGPQRAWTAKPLPDGTWQVTDKQCGLVGSGSEMMRIDRASEDYLASGHTIVLVPLAHPRPLVLTAGRIVSAVTLDTGLHYDLVVEPWGQARRLSHVYVISFSQQ